MLDNSFKTKKCFVGKPQEHFLFYVVNVNPLSPDIKMRILFTVLHTFLLELVRRICINIKTSCPW